MAHDLDLTTLRAFLTVAETGSFSAAGQELHRVQSAISQQVQRLESRLGTTLFERESRQVRLTTAGHEFLPYARQMLALNDRAVGALKKYPNPCKLTLGMPDTLAASWLSPLLQALEARLPWLELSVRCDYSPALWQRWRAGTLDMVIAQDAPTDIDAVALHQEPLRWVVAQNSHAHQAEPVMLACFTDGCCDREKTLSSLKATNRHFHIALSSSNHLAILAGVATGRMVAALPPWALDKASGFRWLNDDEGLPALPDIQISMALQVGFTMTSPCTNGGVEATLAAVVKQIFQKK